MLFDELVEKVQSIIIENDIDKRKYLTRRAFFQDIERVSKASKLNKNSKKKPKEVEKPKLPIPPRKPRFSRAKQREEADRRRNETMAKIMDEIKSKRSAEEKAKHEFSTRKRSK